MIHFEEKKKKLKKTNKYITSGNRPNIIKVGGQQPNCAPFLEFEAHTVALENSKTGIASGYNIFNAQVPIKYLKPLLPRPRRISWRIVRSFVQTEFIVKFTNAVVPPKE